MDGLTRRIDAIVMDIYLMESEEESLRLDMKTDPAAVEREARWAGVRPGMRVADLGCGSGKTTACLYRLASPDGAAVGVDISPSRIDFAQSHYSGEGVRFLCRDIQKPLDDLGTFDLVWVRFVLEYYRRKSIDIVQNVSRLLKPGGILCLIDLDHNCRSHYGLSSRLEQCLTGLMRWIEEKADFDAYAGRKLYSYLYDLGLEEIEAALFPHHLIYGRLNPVDEFNWSQKVEVAGKNSGYPFSEYPDGYQGFHAEFKAFFQDPRRFTYTPVICCKGRKPAGSQV